MRNLFNSQSMFMIESRLFKSNVLKPGYQIFLEFFTIFWFNQDWPISVLNFILQADRVGFQNNLKSNFLICTILKHIFLLLLRLFQMIRRIFVGCLVVRSYAQIYLGNYDEKTDLESYIKTQRNYDSLIEGQLLKYFSVIHENR